MAIIGILLIIFGLYVWHGAVFRARVDDWITNNRLGNTGVYSIVRNPVYSAFMLFYNGVNVLSMSTAKKECGLRSGSRGL